MAAQSRQCGTPRHLMPGRRGAAGPSTARWKRLEETLASYAPKLSDRLRQARPSAAGEATAISMQAFSRLQSRQPMCTERSSGSKSTTLMISIEQDEEDVSQDASRQRNVMVMKVSAAS